MRFKKIFAVVMAAAVTLSTLNGFHGFSAPKTAKAASFVNLNQSQITSAMGAGWNLGNQLEASLNGTPNETSWGNPTINANLIKELKMPVFVPSVFRFPIWARSAATPVTPLILPG